MTRTTKINDQEAQASFLASLSYFDGRSLSQGKIESPERLPVADSDGWQMMLSGFQTKRRIPKPVLGTERLQNWSPRVQNKECYRRRKDALKIKAYAHDRIVVNAYTAPPLVHVRRMSRGSLARHAALYSLELKRETQHGFFVGGKWRFIPTDNKFTDRAKNSIRDGAHILETEGSGVACFLTLTLPADIERAFRCMSAASGYCVNRFNQRLRGEVLDGMFCYAWEVQKRGAPHLHYLFRLPKPVRLETMRQRFRQIWFDILLDVARDSGVDVASRKNGQSWFFNQNMWQVDIRTVQRDYSRYMSKYLSKSESKSTNGFSWRPGRWVGVSYPLRKRVQLRRLSIALPMRSLRCAINAAKSLESVLRQVAKSVKWCGGGPLKSPTCLSIQAANRGGLSLARGIFSLIAYGDYSGLNAYIRDFEPLLANSS